MMGGTTLHHIVRVRSFDDFTYVRNGLMDEVMINANQLENSLQSTAARLARSDLPFSIDPVLWRFQVPAWSRNSKGDTKRNYQRLGQEYGIAAELRLGAGSLLEDISTDTQWRELASNIIKSLKLHFQICRIPRQNPRETLDFPGNESFASSWSYHLSRRVIAPSSTRLIQPEIRSLNRLLARLPMLSQQ